MRVLKGDVVYRRGIVYFYATIAAAETFLWPAVETEPRGPFCSNLPDVARLTLRQLRPWLWRIAKERFSHSIATASEHVHHRIVTRGHLDIWTKSFATFTCAAPSHTRHRPRAIWNPYARIQRPQERSAPQSCHFIAQCAASPPRSQQHH
jgi:hypothetical protein